MNSKELEFFKQLLLDKRKELVEQMDSIRKEEAESSLKEEDGDHSAYSFHLADQGTDSMCQEQNFYHAQRDSRLLYHIDEALNRIEKGVYGHCEICNGLIGKDRLEALPHARLCIACKSKEEEEVKIDDESREESSTFQGEEFDEMY